MVLQIWLLLVALTSSTFGINPGVKVTLTQKGLEYGREIGIAAIQRKLNTINLPDISGSERVFLIGKVKYSFTNMHLTNVGLPQSAVSPVPGAGVQLSIGNAYMSLNGNWRVKYLRVIKDSGSFDLNVNGLSITTTIAISSDETGRPTVSGTNCAASVGSVSIKFHGGASWLYNLFSSFIEKALRSALQEKICPLITDAISDVNPSLKTLNVLAKVDEFAEIEYSMTSSPVISASSVDLSLKGEFYNIGMHQEPPFTPAVFSMPSQSNNMLNIGLSSFTANSAGFVYYTAGALSLYITDDMISASSPIRLNTQTFGAFIPQIAQSFPGLMVKLLVKAVKPPVITFESDNAMIQATGTVTAYAIQTDGTLSPLFVLNMDGSVSAQVSVSGTMVAGSVTLNKMDLTLGTSYFGDFQVKSIDRIFQAVLKVVIIPMLNAQLAKGYPLPTIGKMTLVNTQLQIMKDYVLIGTDVQFAADDSSGTNHIDDYVLIGTDVPFAGDYSSRTNHIDV
uniref:Bactericidal permeability-increasing protein n=1 Tax=Neogobius melanostomus TaxID=47308 RepID=A0A8C6S4N4_9GOBI